MHLDISIRLGKLSDSRDYHAGKERDQGMNPDDPEEIGYAIKALDTSYNQLRKTLVELLPDDKEGKLKDDRPVIESRNVQSGPVKITPINRGERGRVNSDFGPVA